MLVTTSPELDPPREKTNTTEKLGRGLNHRKSHSPLKSPELISLPTEKLLCPHHCMCVCASCGHSFCLCGLKGKTNGSQSHKNGGGCPALSQTFRQGAMRKRRPMEKCRDKSAVPLSQNGGDARAQRVIIDLATPC